MDIKWIIGIEIAIFGVVGFIFSKEIELLDVSGKISLANLFFIVLLTTWVYKLSIRRQEKPKNETEVKG